MCAECRKYPCAATCPNAPEPESVGKCKLCGEDIVEGEEMVDYYGDLFHFECLRFAGTREVLELFDVAVVKAGD